MNDLLPYYERELSIFRQYSREFSERYPKTAGQLFISGESCEDPHIERLIQSFALLTARVAKRLDSDYPKFTESMLESLYPHYLRPLPSHSIVQIGSRGRENSETIRKVSRGSLLASAPVQGVICQFQTAYEVTLAPIVVSKAEFSSILDAAPQTQLPRGVTSGISITFESLDEGLDLRQSALKKLRIFIDGEPSLRSALIDTLFLRAAVAFVQVTGAGPWVPLSEIPLSLVGLADDEAMIPFTARSHPAFRLLTEYFSYPEKFNFIDIDLAEIASLLPPNCQSFTLHLALSGLLGDSNEARLLGAMSSKNFLLGCTPVINLFKKRGVPIQLTRTSADNPLLADATNASGYEIHSVDAVRLIRESVVGHAVTEFTPLYGARHGDPIEHKGNYWLTRRDGSIAAISPGHEVRIALVEADFKPSNTGAATLSTELTCTNRDLPCSLRFGHLTGDLTTDAVPTSLPIRLLRKPTPPYRFDSNEGAHWRLISHLALNYANLNNAGLADFQKMLTLYDLPRSAISQRQINGIVGLESGTVRAWMRTVPVSSLMPGIGIRMTVDEQAFVGSGLYVFAQVLDRYFGLNSQLNCFTQLEVVSAQTGEEILKCPPRSAEKIRT